MRYGGNTSCVEVELSDGSRLILDAGTGIRNLGLALGDVRAPLNILLTHLHLDHIQGLMFFAPAFRHQCEITVWGPPSGEASLCERVARYISAPLAPVDVREMPFVFREAERVQWQIGCATVRAQPVNHRGPTLGYRIDDGDTSLCYIPDHEPGVGTPLCELADEWVSGLELACEASLLLHDCQYTDEEYPAHVGWGHCPVGDALAFAHRARVGRVLLFHHDPLHCDDLLDDVAADCRRRWAQLGGHPDAVELAAERRELEVVPAPAPARAPLGACDPLGGRRGVGELAKEPRDDEHGLLGDVNRIVAHALQAATHEHHEHRPLA
jgi:phosphoribosyl 1,2-cyclic phosphodiesterase